MVIEHHGDQQDEGDCKVHQACQQAGDRHQETGEIHLCDEVCIANQAVAGFRQRKGEQLPWKQSAVGENRIWHPIRRHLGKPPEDYAEDHHGHKRLKKSPSGAEGRLLVSDLDIAPAEEVKQLAIFPKTSEIQHAQTATGLDVRDAELSVRCSYALQQLANAP